MEKTEQGPPVLCYVDEPWAYFTTQKLEDQWGDDWEDSPYEHNAGKPYGPCFHNEPSVRNDPNAKRGYRPNTVIPLAVGELCRCEHCQKDWYEDGAPRFQIIKVAFDGPFDTPCQESKSNLKGAWRGHSVMEINTGSPPWLFNDNAMPYPIIICAGTTLADFITKIKAGGGTIYLPDFTP